MPLPHTTLRRGDAPHHQRGEDSPHEEGEDEGEGERGMVFRMCIYNYLFTTIMCIYEKKLLCVFISIDIHIL